MTEPRDSAKDLASLKSKITLAKVGVGFFLLGPTLALGMWLLAGRQPGLEDATTLIGVAFALNFISIIRTLRRRIELLERGASE